MEEFTETVMVLLPFPGTGFGDADAESQEPPEVVLEFTERFRFPAVLLVRPTVCGAGELPRLALNVRKLLSRVKAAAASAMAAPNNPRKVAREIRPSNFMMRPPATVRT